MRRPCEAIGGYQSAPNRACYGFSIIELLISLAVLSLLLLAASSLIIGSARTQNTVDTQIRATMTASALTEIINYEVALAGYTGTGAASGLPADAQSLVVAIGGSGSLAQPSDTITIRFIEDTFLGDEDDGVRRVTYGVSETGELVRTAVGSESIRTDALIGGVREMRVVEFVGRDRSIVTAQPGVVLPAEVAGIRVEARFESQETWTFLVGLYNRQRVQVSGDGE